MVRFLQNEWNPLVNRLLDERIVIVQGPENVLLKDLMQIRNLHSVAHGISIHDMLYLVSLIAKFFEEIQENPVILDDREIQGVNEKAFIGDFVRREKIVVHDRRSVDDDVVVHLLQDLQHNSDVSGTEIMVNGPDHVYVERIGETSPIRVESSSASAPPDRYLRIHAPNRRWCEPA